jgi:hypothetical protein
MTPARRLMAAALVAAAAAQSDPWAPLRVFEGKWEGPAPGKPGNGRTTREYRFELGGRFLVARNRSVYEPRPPGAKPEVHEDIGYFSYARAQKKLVLRQFHIEGFVNEYALETLAPDGKALEFITQRIGNIPQGWRAKEAYRILSPGEIEETFPLAEPGKDFEVYSTSRLKRIQ